MNDLKVTLVQSDLYWEDTAKNLDMFSRKLDSLQEHTDLIVLPEMFNTGFSMEAAKLAEEPNGETMRWMYKMAEMHDCVVTGSMIIYDDNRFYNRLIWMQKDGSFGYYNKRHLFRLGMEDRTYTAGAEKLIMELHGWRICPLICYDLRFPVWCRNTSEYDLLLFVANWPEKRIAHWNTLLSARAIENQCYVVGVNRVGTDGNGIYHSGDSLATDAHGQTIWHKSREEAITTITLSKEELMLIRRQLPFLKDADRFMLE